MLCGQILRALGNTFIARSFSERVSVNPHSPHWERVLEVIAMHSIVYLVGLVVVVLFVLSLVGLR